MADPYLLGVSAGGSLGATLALLLGVGTAGILGAVSVPIAAFLGSLVAAGAVFLIGVFGSASSPVKLVLAGSAVNALCTAISSSFVYFAANAEGIRSVTFWSLGSFASATWQDVVLLAAIVACGLGFTATQVRHLDVLLTGDESAVTLGVDPVARRSVYLLVCALVTGILVSRVGIIGFVGLLVPHVVRGLVGSRHARLLPAAVTAGAIFMLWADVIARMVIPSAELPIGIVTAVLGAPVFLHMLTRKDFRHV